jgi:DNA-directed RNA polymerase specialized sigma24 family protein
MSRTAPRPASPGLSPELRHLLRLFVLHGRSVRDLARLLGIPEAGVRARLLQARTLLLQQRQSTGSAEALPHHPPYPSMALRPPGDCP